MGRPQDSGYQRNPPRPTEAMPPHPAPPFPPTSASTSGLAAIEGYESSSSSSSSSSSDDSSDSDSDDSLSSISTDDVAQAVSKEEHSSSRKASEPVVQASAAVDVVDELPSAICPHWEKNGRCRQGDRCLSAHPVRGPG